MRILNSCVLQQDSILQTGVCASQSSRTLDTRLLVFDKTLAQPDFAVVNCSDAPCFNTQLDIFVVMNCCVVVLSLFSSDILTWSADSLYSVQ